MRAPAAVVATVILMTTAMVSLRSRASERDVPQRETPANVDADPSPFASSYLTLGVARNFPVSLAEDEFSPGGSHPIVGYRHRTTGDWLMSLKAQFKMLRTRRENVEVPLFTFTHEALYVMRLEHPVYLAVGPRLLWMMPSRSAMLPMKRDGTRKTEFGLAAAAELIWVADDEFFASLGIDRWRGTDSMRLHGIESWITVGIALN